MKHNSNVPAFLTKLWTLVEDADTNELICWSQEGNSFLVLDEQRFAKEILPKFFKHNNMASFIRQLNMYGFRKVMHIDTGFVKQERDGPVEFQHPYFKHGQDGLLENIKRKVSNTRPEDNKIRHEDLTKILASVQSVHSQQENIDTRLAALKRENEALWMEISDLRQKHAHQQQLIKKLIHFIVKLVQNNHILNIKRKRPVLVNSSGKKPKYIHQIYDDKSCVTNVKGSEVSNDIIICDVTEKNPEDYFLLIIKNFHTVRSTYSGDIKQTEDAVSTAADDNLRSRHLDSSDTTSSALQLNKPSGLSLEDPVKLMDSILKENGAISQNINLLGKLELMDYLDSIDCSLEDFQAMLCGKQSDVEFDFLECPSRSMILKHKGTKSKKQLIQYTSCPLLAFLDGCSPPPDANLVNNSSASPSNTSVHPTSSSDMSLESEAVLLDTSLESMQPARSSLILLDQLTEAEASEQTLFYLCELPEDNFTQLDKV
uniref:HSF-type DNA-binding domain-containing protein n=1 Tax=Mola mola TaxID=94237 RepID=A0A3Q4BJ81_MOLML